MIKEIRYKNFKALRDTVLPLERFTLIVGANGTGKTTALKGIEFIQRVNKDDFDKIISVDVKGIQNNVEIIVVWDSSDKYEVYWVSTINSHKEIHQNFTRQGQIPSDVEKQQQRNKIESFTIFSFDSNKIAEPVLIKPDIELEENGRGLVGVLDQLRDSHPEKFEELNRELNQWFYEYDRILFETPKDGVKSFLLRTTLGKNNIKAKDLSQGTLLALAYLTLAYLPNPPKIVAFEEPEKGIHPRLLENIQEAMYRLAYPENYGEKREPVQVIATTHSPYLLDLYKDFPEEIVIASKDEKGVHFERLIDKPHYEEVLQDAPLGEIWYSGILGGVPANL